MMMMIMIMILITFNWQSSLSLYYGCRQPLIEKRRGSSPGCRFPPGFIHNRYIVTGADLGILRDGGGGVLGRNSSRGGGGGGSRSAGIFIY